MPCDTIYQYDQAGRRDAAAEARKREQRKAAQKELEADLASGRRRIIRTAQGKLAISNWATSAAAQSGWCENCVLTSIQKTGSWIAKQTIQKQLQAANVKLKSEG